MREEGFRNDRRLARARRDPGVDEDQPGDGRGDSVHNDRQQQAAAAVADEDERVR
jgi:hypothetical protein